MKQIGIYFICAIIILNLSGCCTTTKTPNIKSVNKLYAEYKEEIDSVVNFLAITEYDVIIISDSSGTMIADLQTIEIPDLNIRETINHLIGTEIVKRFYKDNRNIEINIWNHKETRYWMACTIDNTIPSVQYATEVIPMDETGWYFVIASYSKWRIRNK